MSKYTFTPFCDDDLRILFRDSEHPRYKRRQLTTYMSFHEMESWFDRRKLSANAGRNTVRQIVREQIARADHSDRNAVY